MEWFRLYNEFADDPKVQTMSEAMQRRLVMLFCLRSKDALTKITDEELRFFLRISSKELKMTKEIFKTKGFIDDDWQIIKWEKRQFKSDQSTPRVKAFRERQKTSQCNDNVTLQETNCNALDTDTDTEQIQNKPLMPLSKNVNELDTAIGDFIKMRKTIKKPMSDKAVELMLKKLDKMARTDEEKIAILHQSIMNSWQGIFPLKEEQRIIGPPPPRQFKKVVGEDMQTL